jgi:predicted pyridoxine 5'-phosphate oxidase superfamily flavin-nucleotide-binding protein
LQADALWFDRGFFRGAGMSNAFHTGEQAVQARAGTAAMAAKIGTGIHPEIAPAAQRFLAAQTLLIVGAADHRGALWATALSGAPGFAVAEDERTVRLAVQLPDGDRLKGELRVGTPLALLAIEFASRRRLRLNGVVIDVTPSHVRMRSDQCYGNCPKYIQRREPGAQRSIRVAHGEARSGAALSAAQQAWVAACDTFFIATAHPDAGADVSHRGGNPGFVHVVDPRTLIWPDYTGNGMFQTLGNLALHPAAGLLFLDFDAGRTLQLTGNAAVRWDSTEGFPGAERLMRFAVDCVVEVDGAFPGGWQLVERSPFNPA